MRSFRAEPAGPSLLAVGMLVGLLTASCTATGVVATTRPDPKCHSQSGMTGDLASDLPGLWRADWTLADNSTSTGLYLFNSDGTATVTDARQRTSYRTWDIVAGNEVRLFTGDSMATQIWEFSGEAWRVRVKGYGSATLERCEG
jgi:hypothetical protein